MGLPPRVLKVNRPELQFDVRWAQCIFLKRAAGAWRNIYSSLGFMDEDYGVIIGKGLYVVI